MAVFEIAERERIQAGGDAGGDERGVMGEHGGHRRPGDADAGHELRIEVVGMQFDQTRQQVVAGEVDRLGIAGIGFYSVDVSVANTQRPVYDAVGQNELRIGQGEVDDRAGMRGNGCHVGVIVQ